MFEILLFILYFSRPAFPALTLLKREIAILSLRGCGSTTQNMHHFIKLNELVGAGVDLTYITPLPLRAFPYPPMGGLRPGRGYRASHRKIARSPSCPPPILPFLGAPVIKGAI